MSAGVTLAPGLVHHSGFLDGPAQARLSAEIAALLRAAPPYTPRMPRSGRPFSVRMSNAGALGWVSDVGGYRYQATHPQTGEPWPAIPPTALETWAAIAGYAAPPEACLVNLYDPGTRMGLHQDRDEDDLDAPVLSLSLGASALFRYGGLKRSDPTRSIRLARGDAVVIGGPSRLIFHGVDRILPVDRSLFTEASVVPAELAAFLPEGGRVNLTLRRVNRPAPVSHA